MWALCLGWGGAQIRGHGSAVALRLSCDSARCRRRFDRRFARLGSGIYLFIYYHYHYYYWCSLIFSMLLFLWVRLGFVGGSFASLTVGSCRILECRAWMIPAATTVASSLIGGVKCEFELLVIYLFIVFVSFNGISHCLCYSCTPCCMTGLLSCSICKRFISTKQASFLGTGIGIPTRWKLKS